MNNNSTIKELLDQMGQAGARLDQMHAVKQVRETYQYR